MSTKKYCPAIVVMLRSVLDLPTRDIARYSGYSVNAVCGIISRKCPELKRTVARKTNVNVKLIETDYLAGMSLYKLEDKYGVDRRTIGKWMKKLGHERGKGHGVAAENSYHQKLEDGKQHFLMYLEEQYGGNFECVEYYGRKEPCILKCNKCGNTFSRWYDYRKQIRCPFCYEKEQELQKEKRNERLAILKEQCDELRRAEYAKDKICLSCGNVFHSENKTQIYCCKTCSRRAKRKRATESGKTKLVSYCNHRKRARTLGVAYEPGISLKKLIERDNNTCQICGLPCDERDTRWGCSGPLYPSIDHITAMTNGGGHTWDNVQLAHCICNSEKRDLTENELTEEVIAHAKEQATSYQCA